MTSSRSVRQKDSLLLRGVEVHGAGMNKAQRIALGVGLAVFVISLLAVPWSYQTQMGDRTLNDSGRTPLWNVENEGEMNAPAMLLDWAIIGIITGGAIVLLKKPKE